MLLVCLTFVLDIMRLEAKFVHNYHPRISIFYASLCNERGEEKVVIDENLQQWDPLWIEENDAFEAKF